MSMLENGRLTTHALRTAAEAARFWPSTVSGESNIAHINGAAVSAAMKIPWNRWYNGAKAREDKPVAPIPIEVPG